MSAEFDDPFGAAYWDGIDSYAHPRPITGESHALEGDLGDPASNDELADGARSTPTSPYQEGPGRHVQPACPDCPFAGSVEDFSIDTARVTPPNEVMSVLFEEDGHTSGRVVMRLPGDSYGTGDDLATAGVAVHSIEVCARNSNGPLDARRSILGVQVGRAATVCGAFFIKSSQDRRPQRKPGILEVTDAND